MLKAVQFGTVYQLGRKVMCVNMGKGATRKK
jgi:hypothetical protein